MQSQNFRDKSRNTSKLMKAGFLCLSYLKKVPHVVFSDTRDGLCCKLDLPCPAERPVVEFGELEIARESIKILKKLGSGRCGDLYSGKSQLAIHSIKVRTATFLYSHERKGNMKIFKR